MTAIRKVKKTHTNAWQRLNNLLKWIHHVTLINPICCLWRIRAASFIHSKSSLASFVLNWFLWQMEKQCDNAIYSFCYMMVIFARLVWIRYQMSFHIYVRSTWHIFSCYSKCISLPAASKPVPAQFDQFSSGCWVWYSALWSIIWS